MELPPSLPLSSLAGHYRVPCPLHQQPEILGRYRVVISVDWPLGKRRIWLLVWSLVVAGHYGSLVTGC